MKHIFITHAGPDASMAQRLQGDLKNIGHEVRIDVTGLRLGDNSIRFMNEGLGDAHTIIILYSMHIKQAKWQQREVEAATWQEINEGKTRVIVLPLDDTTLPPLLAPKVFAKLTDTTYAEVLDRLSKAIIPETTASDLVSAAFKEDSPNPFWRLRAEYFENLPREMAAAFSQPEAEKIAMLDEMRPCLLEGSRGTGKTMLLMSLRARNLAVRKGAKKTTGDLFGFYLRLTRGAFCNAGLFATPDGDLNAVPAMLAAQITETFAQELYVSLIESLLSELVYCAKEGWVKLDGGRERLVCEGIHAVIHSEFKNFPPGLNDLQRELGQLHSRLAEFTKRKFIYQENATVPIATLDIASFKQIIDVVKTSIPELKGSQFTLLLDEYENLLRHQKLVVNDMVKLGPPDLSVKIAKKVGTAETSDTLSGQQLQEIHDYTRIPLVYSVDDDKELRNYRSLLAAITLRALASQSVTITDVNTLLPKFSKPEFSANDIEQEVKQLVGVGKWNRLSAGERQERLAHYSHTAAYRLIYGKPGGGREKEFAGFEDLAFLSSGVIRYFQEIVGMAYHLQFAAQALPAHTVAIEPDHQTRAVYVVSQHNLAALSRNVERYGERLKYLLLDLGDCLRYKLLRHPSEPESGRLAITDPERLSGDEFREVSEFLTLGVREGVFQGAIGRPGMRPKHSGDPQPVEFNISRIFCPVLQFSPRFRWRTLVTSDDFKNLLLPERRKSGMKKLFQRLVSLKPQTGQGMFNLR